MEGKTIEELYAAKEALEEEIASAAKSAPLPDWAQHVDTALGGGVCTLSTSGPGCINVDANRVGKGCPTYFFGAEYNVSMNGSSGPGLIRFLDALLSLERSREAARLEAAAEKVESEQ